MHNDIKHLEPLLSSSIVKEFKRGIRRYFPISSTKTDDLEYLKEAFFIIYGRKPKNDSEISFAVLFHGLNGYVENFNGKLFVRTIYKTKQNESS